MQRVMSENTRIAWNSWLFELFCEITDLLSGSEYPTLNLCFENVWKIDMFLKEQVETSDPIIQELLIELRHSLVELNVHIKFDVYCNGFFVCEEAKFK